MCDPHDFAETNEMREWDYAVTTETNEMMEWDYAGALQLEITICGLSRLYPWSTASSDW